LNNNLYIPHASPVKTVVDSFWQVEGSPRYNREHIIPQGMVEIIFNFSDSPPISAHLPGKKYCLGNCFINGFNTVPVRLELPKQQKFFGIRIQPLAVKKIFGVASGEFTNIVVDLTLVDSGANSLWHQLAEQPDFDNRVSVFSSWIQKKLPVWQPQDEMVNQFLSGVDQHDLSVKDLAYSLCYSPRHLSRKMFEATGMNTEEILLYKKYLHAVHLIHHTDLSLTNIAYQSNFSDQSHFIRSFKNYSQMTPGEYKKTKGFVKGHVFENVR
jgi:AraC-like DNA-binding protein